MQRPVSKALLYYHGRKSDETHAKRIKRIGPATSVHEKRVRRESKLRRSGTGLSMRRRRREAVPEVGAWLPDLTPEVARQRRRQISVEKLSSGVAGRPRGSLSSLPSASAVRNVAPIPAN